MRVEDEHLDVVLRFIGRAIEKYVREDVSWPDLRPLDFSALSSLARGAQTVLGEAVANDPELLDAVRRLDAALSCPAFLDCPLERCEGIVYCIYYNLGGSHGYDRHGRRLELSWEEHRTRILEALGI